MSEPLLGESTAQDDQRVVRPCVSSGHFWINPYRSGTDLVATPSANPWQLRNAAADNKQQSN
jgi:hypothetical protein